MMTSEEEEESAPLNHVFLPVGQNFVSVLNDPLAEEESWWWPSSDTPDPTIPAESTFTPAYTNPDPDVSDSLAFFENVARDTSTPSPRHTSASYSSSSTKEDNEQESDEEVLKTVPKIFFESDLRLTDPHTFETVLPQRQVEHTALLLHERLTHLLDIIEVTLLRRVAARSNQVFAAVEQYRLLLTSVTHCLARVHLLRQRLNAVQRHAVGNPLQITRLRTAKSNMLALQHRLAAIRELTSTPSSVELLLATDKHEAALEMIHSHLTALEEGHYGEDVWELHCVRDVVRRLHEQQTEVCIGIAEMVVAVTARTFLEALPDATHPPDLLTTLRPHGDHLPNTIAGIAMRIAEIAAYNTYLAAVDASNTDTDTVTHITHHNHNNDHTQQNSSNINGGDGNNTNSFLVAEVEDVPSDWDPDNADPITCAPEHVHLVLQHASKQGQALIDAAARFDRRLVDVTGSGDGQVVGQVREAVDDMLVRICEWCRPGGKTRSGSWRAREISNVVSVVLEHYDAVHRCCGLSTRSGSLERAAAEWIREKLKDEYSRITESLPKIIRQDPWTRERIPARVQHVLDSLREGRIEIEHDDDHDNDTDADDMANGVRLGPSADDSPLHSVTFSGIRLVLIIQGLLPLLKPFVDANRELLARPVLSPITREILQTFLHLLKNFNSNIYQMILGGGLYNLRNSKIRTNSVAITVPIVELEFSIEQWLRNIFENILSENQRIFMEELDRFEEEMQGHRNNLLKKMSSILRAATDSTITKYNWSNLPAPSPVVQLAKSLSKFYGPIREYLSENDARHVFQNGVSLSLGRLADAVSNLTPSPRVYQFMQGEVRELRRRMQRFSHLCEPDFSPLENAVEKLKP